MGDEVQADEKEQIKQSIERNKKRRNEERESVMS